MTERRATISTGHLVQQPGGEVTIDQPTSHAGRAAALVLAAVAILMMVVL